MICNILSLADSAISKLWLKIKCPDIYIPPLTGKPEQQRFMMRSGVLASISSRQRSAISSCPLTERTFDPQSAARQDPHYAPANRTIAFTR